jgi:phenylalanine-4-hydroxylase
MFHDVFGHIPLLSEQFFCDYLQGISEITLAYIDNPLVVEMMARLYWYTVEFGLITEKGQMRIYGAGILSSSGESAYSLSAEATHVPFDPIEIMATPYIKDKFQAKYFVIDSYEQLFHSLPTVRANIDNVLAKQEIAA